MTKEAKAILLAKTEADRLTFTAAIVTVVFGLIMVAGFVSWEKQMQRDAVVSQEQVKW